LNMYEMDINTRKCRPIIFMNGSKQVDSIYTEPIWTKSYKNGFLLSDEHHGIFEIKGDNLFAELLLPFKENISIEKVILYEDRYLFLKNWRQKGTFPLNFSFENKNGKWERITHLLDSLEWTYIFFNKKDQTHWVGFKYELVHYDKNFHVLKTYREEDGYNGSVQNMLADNDGNLWLTNLKNQLGRLNTATGIFTTLSETEGFQKQNYDWHGPAAKDVLGNLYFGGMNIDAESGGLDRIRPEKYSSGKPSYVYLRSLTINQKPFPLSVGVNIVEELSLGYNQNTINIETGIIDFYSKGKSRLRYKLEVNNKDQDWQYAPAYHSIRYEGLSPGNYKLVMQASNAGNEFNGPEKILTITIHPPFWQTWWFRIIAIVALLLSFYGIYRWRTATLRKQKRVLEQTVKERTAEVVAEKVEVEKQKAKSDELLLNILPSEVAEELKEKGYTTAKSFDEVTILFSDIKGFTHVAENLTAQELVKEIDTYFSAFDRIMLHYGLEKIKTIGDAYIAAGALPEENKATAQNVVEAALAMQQEVEKLKKERVEKNRPYFELRIGIHTGPVVAGVVGIKKFQYDIWGNTVNLAARMEQSGVPGKINISQYTYEKVKNQFKCIHRGKIEAKNKGEVDMYFVE
ncbi:MAG: adenylate/guanylate cyclase domain-containing protein, partial [Chitinophagaceae bacterium]